MRTLVWNPVIVATLESLEDGEDGGGHERSRRATEMLTGVSADVVPRTEQHLLRHDGQCHEQWCRSPAPHNPHETVRS